jgi:hypothetical protein
MLEDQYPLAAQTILDVQNMPEIKNLSSIKPLRN